MKGDPVQMFAKFKGFCDRCGHRINKGDVMYWYPRTKTKHCECGHKGFMECMSLLWDDDNYRAMHGDMVR